MFVNLLHDDYFFIKIISDIIQLTAYLNSHFSSYAERTQL